MSRRGPLAKVWLAAHYERKLSKTQTLQTDINQSVGAIIGDEIEIMALRVTGQLLLGVVRIYSRKAKYLLDDCNEALVKIKLAFRPGAVDMTEEQMIVSKGAITLQDGGINLDLLLPDATWDLDFADRPQAHGQNLARAADITLQTGDDLNFDFNDQNYGFDLGMGDGIDSQDFDDLGLDFGKADEGEGDISIEVGRRAGTANSRMSVDSRILGDGGAMDLDVLSRLSREPSEHGMDIAPMDVDMDLGLGGDETFDLGIAFDNDAGSEAQTPGLARSPSRASSPLTPPPPNTPPAIPADGGATPKKTSPVKRKPRNVEKKLINDEVTELAGGPGAKGGNLGPAVNRDVSSILVEPRYLPSSRTVARLQEICNDPIAHFMPTKVTPEGTFFFAGPPGLAPELLDMFMFPTNGSYQKRRAVSPNGEGRTPKKRRVEPDAEAEQEDVELGRREGSRAPSFALGSEIMGGDHGDGINFDDPANLGMDDFQMPAYDDQIDISLHDDTRLSTPGVDEQVPDFEDGDAYVDMSCPIALFDTSQATQEQRAAEEAAATGEGGDRGKGYSKNTARALQILRRELAPPAEPPMSFANVSEKATRRAAASFFFELLVLGTRDCVKLSQGAAYENIEVRPKDRLWERQPRVRESSLAPSLAESLASGL
ncbi:Rec8 like protein-domain-containing protein [Auriculariales sp. MPI-PUGE-AT-0066]|nr:Rec8 like protein-domain-containing protein [Auriculariales sp. MPI-PUGE-AT-0066]